jgi:CysZ protein
MRQAVKGVARAPIGFWRGFGYAFKGLGFVFGKHPELARIWIFPIFLTFLAFIGAVWGAWELQDDLVNLIWEDPTGDGFLDSAGRVAHGFLELIAFLMLLVTSFFVVLGLSTVLAAPFNDALSEEVEHLTTGRKGPPFSWLALLRDVVRTVALELVKFFLWAGVMIPLFVMSFALPVAGQILYSVVGYLFTSLYFAIDYIDWPAARRNKALSYRSKVLTERFAACFGFGSGVFLLLWVPFLNLFFMPAAVAGGTLLFLDLEGQGPGATALALQGAQGAPGPGGGGGAG